MIPDVENDDPSQKQSKGVRQIKQKLYIKEGISRQSMFLKRII